MKIQMWQLQQRQGLDLEVKERMSKERIKAFYEKFEGKVYVCYSGGKDSTVLLHLVRSVYPEVEGICIGTEPPENVALVKATDNCKVLFPELPMSTVIQKYGYPIISKDVSKCISRFRGTKHQKMKEYYLMGSKGKKMGVIPKKWKFLINAPFKISDMCCDICKKKPLKNFEKQSGKYPIIGTMAADSEKRKRDYLKKGCNVFEGKNIQSNPIAFWTEKDVWDYIKKYDVPYSKWYDMGYKRSGCFQCLFGIHLEAEPNRIQMMQKTHPKLYKHCIEDLHYDKVLSFLGIPYTTTERQECLCIPINDKRRKVK
jgi:3'-phosphoadenosine 5'-phosphosulfate sulfotransferase (PAPS reductase)/FAD synthetase